MKIFGLGSKLKDKLTAQRFEYAVTVHNLSPWPESGRAVAVGWQRGRRRRGATRSVYPASQPGRLGTVCRFNEKFELTATLYKAPSGSANANQMGPFKKKCLILAVLETDGRTQATAALGRVVIDLAEFAAVDKQETRAFMVSCHRQIHAAVGEPQLLITIRTRWKKSSATVGADGEVDESGSMSTDTTGSRMTANLSSFLRYKYTGQGPATSNEEQDLRGFDADKMKSMRRREDPGLTTLDEEPHDELPDSPSMARNMRAPGPGPLGIGMQRARAAMGPGNPQLPPPYPHENGRADGMFEGGLRSKYASGGGGGPMGIQPAGIMGISSNAAAYGANAAAARMANLSVGGSSTQGNGSYTLANGNLPSGSPRSTLDDLAATNSHISTPQGAVRAMGLQHMSSMGSDSLQNELLVIAASEMTVHLARAVAVNSRRADRAAHGAARRIVRTMVCLGPQQAPTFGTHVLRLINSQLECSTGDLQALAFWWSNLAQLRALMYNACNNATLAPQVGDSMAPQVQRLERFAFDSIVSYLWEGVLLPAVLDSSAAAGAAGGALNRQTTVTAATKRTQQEAAIKRWFEGLRQVAQKLSKLQAVRPVQRGVSPAAGHTGQLRQQALLQCLKRLDALLFCHLVTPSGRHSPDLMSDYDPSNSIWGAPGNPPPSLDDASLPFTKGLLTFGSGMSIKMTVTRLQQWATSEGGLSDAGGPQGVQAGPGGGGTSLFPLLRAVADLLMMPKELLMEASIRRDVCQALSIRSILHILSNFQPDEYAVDAISQDILINLQDEEAAGQGMRPPLTDLTQGYKQPPEEVLLGKVLTGMEPGVEYDADSEDELVGFGSMAAPAGASSRFRLLHELWYGGARFRSAMSVASSSRMGSQP